MADMTEDTKTIYEIPEIAPQLGRGPVWLRQRRADSREAFNATPLPRRGLHLWRYTDPAKFLVEPVKTEDTSFGNGYDSVVKLEQKHVDDGRLAGLIVDFGGREILRYGVPPLLNMGVMVCPLSEAVETRTDLVEQYLYQIVNEATGKFEAMNGALWNDGIFMYIPDNTVIEKPIHLLREAGLAHSSVYPRTLIIVGRNSQATIIDEYGGGSSDFDDGFSYSNGVVEIFGQEDSNVRYVSVQRQAKATNSYLTHRARIEHGAQMLTMSLAFGASLAKHNFGVILNGAGADSRMYGLAFGSARQQFDSHTLHHHAHGQTTSNIDFKVVLRDRATSAYTGLIRIDQHAKTCEAYQENRNLLLNKGTKADTIPELEILNEDVTCTHGATVGPIDPMEIFYLTSRGIYRDEAVRMIVEGFTEPTLKMLPNDLQERISEFVMDRLEDI